MDAMEDAENNTKVTDSAYSNSCSNQSRISYEDSKNRQEEATTNSASHSTKSTHSGSNSSGSSGYDGKLTCSEYSSNNQSESPTKDKEPKILTPIQTELQVSAVKNEIESSPEIEPVFESSPEEMNAVQTPTPLLIMTEKVPDTMEASDGKDKRTECNTSVATPINIVTSCFNFNEPPDGFSCLISVQDGIVMDTTSSIATALGYSKEMWIGRPFIDFVHPRDRNSFASQISNGIVTPQNANSAHLQEQVFVTGELLSTMVCRVRRYKALNSGFGISERMIGYIPFLLKFFFKTLTEDAGEVIYLVIEGSPFLSAFTTPNEVVTEPTPFVLRHSANGKLDYIDTESVPYLGYLPQDISQKDILQLYYPSDLIYLRQVYEVIMREGGLERSRPYSIKAQNGDFVKLETEWSTFINPWTKKLEYVIAKNFIIEGPKNPDVFQTPEPVRIYKTPTEEDVKAQAVRDSIVNIMNEILTKPAEAAKMQMSRRCQDLASYMDSVLDEIPKPEEELRVEVQDVDHHYYYEPDLEIFGGISPNHDYLDSHMNSETPLTYTQVNNDDNLLRFFDNHEAYTEEDKNALAISEKASIEEMAKKSPDVAINSPVDMDEIGSISDSSAVVVPVTIPECNFNGYQSLRLTESLINKHNVEMEQELLKIHRETRLCKSERDKALSESKQKMKEHLARCNAPFQPTISGLTNVDQTHGEKRPSKHSDGHTQKHRCTSRNRTKKSYVPPLPALTYVSPPRLPPSSYSAFNVNPYVMGTAAQPQMSTLGYNNTRADVMPKGYAPSSSYQVPYRSDAAYPSLPYATYHRDSNISTLNHHNMEYQNMMQQMKPQSNTSVNRNVVYPNTMPLDIYQQHQQHILKDIPLDMTYQQLQQNDSNNLLPGGIYQPHQQENINNIPLDLTYQQYQQKSPRILSNETYKLYQQNNHNIILPDNMYQQHQQNNSNNIALDITYQQYQQNFTNNILPANVYQQHQRINLNDVPLDIAYQQYQQNTPHKVLPDNNMYQQHQFNNTINTPRDIPYQQVLKNIPNNVLPNMYQQHHQNNLSIIPPNIMYQQHQYQHQQNNPNNVPPNILYQKHQQNNSHNVIPYMYQQRQQNISRNLTPNMYQQHQRNNSYNVTPNMYQQHHLSNSYNNVIPNMYQQHQENYQMHNITAQQFYGSPYRISPVQQQTRYPMQQNYLPQQPLYNKSMEMSSSNNEESTDERSKKKSRFYHSDSNDKTDGESSYSSFYSSFFKTDSGSNEESDAKSRTKKKITQASLKHQRNVKKSKTAPSTSNERTVTGSMDTSWLDPMCITSEQLYKYQIVNKESDSVLNNDKEKLHKFAQFPQVSNQLHQLYIDLQLQGVTAKLSLDEGITSSSCSEEERSNHAKASTSKHPRQKRAFNKMVMIYEENAPLPNLSKTRGKGNGSSQS